MDAFANHLMILAKDCDNANVTAARYKKEAALESGSNDNRGPPPDIFERTHISLPDLLHHHIFLHARVSYYHIRFKFVIMFKPF